MSAPKVKAPKYRETYESRMLNELAARLVELEENFRDHLLDCEAAAHDHVGDAPKMTDPAAAFKRTPTDLPIVRPQCELCRDGIPHTAGVNCDSARRDMAKRL